MRFRVLFSMLVLSSVIQADEGMWVPQQLNEIAGPLKKAGLQLDPSDFADLTGQPMGAVVSIGGCTASFISPNGLVATNHHCAYGGIQLNSTPENNLLANGFVAKVEEVLKTIDFPIKIKNVRLADSPMTAVANGCFLAANL